MDVLETRLGTYRGEGRWHDDAGNTHRYLVDLTLEVRSEDLGLRFRHDFIEEDIPEVVLDVTLTRVAPGILTFDLSDEISGRGYFTEDMLHYTIPLPGNSVEATYFFQSDGCRVAGSSEKNAAGNFIMWSEDLRREV